MQSATGRSLNQHVLVVDDDPDLCETLAAVAVTFGATSETATTFGAFRESVSKRQPDVVLLDLCMPDVDGIGHLQYLGEIGSTAPILLMSGYDQRVLNAARRVAAARGLTIAETLEKPIEVGRLGDALRRISAASDAFSLDELRQSVTDDLVTVFVQPKVAISPSAVRCPDLSIVAGDRSWPLVGVEALARVEHPLYGIVSPGSFISLAEQNGLIGDLTEMVFRKTIARQTLWGAHGFRVPVAINIAPMLMNDPVLPDKLCRLIAEAGGGAAPITLEITESSALAANQVCLEALARVRLKGFGLSLDDFGTGFSSLVQLYRMPFSELKIDRSFVSEVAGSPEARAIVRSTISLAHELGLTVCAEGVETKQTAEFLGECGCDCAQGFFFSRPRSIADFEADVLQLGGGTTRALSEQRAQGLFWMGAPRASDGVWTGPGYTGEESVAC